MIFCCAPAKPVWKSTPEIRSVGNSIYDAKMQPMKSGYNFYDKFQLDIINHSNRDLKIDWNRTKYIHNGQARGVFVFKGINPEDVRNATIPLERISSGETFIKIIAPHSMLARPGWTSRAEKGTSPGILPSGENTIHLVVLQDGKEVIERLTVVLDEIQDQ